MTSTYMKTLLMACISLAAVSLSACNTIEGAGEDIQSGGKAIERSANETKKSM